MTAITAKSFRVCRIDHSQEERIFPASRWQVFCARVESVKPEMNIPTSGQPAADLRDYLAEERTFLAWIRTGIALMAFGIVLAHFGISADEAHATRYASEVEPHELSLWFGTALITIGVIVNLFSAWRYMRLVGQLNRRQFVRRSVSKQGVIVAVLLALFGIAMAIYMIMVVPQLPDPLLAYSPEMLARIHGRQ